MTDGAMAGLLMAFRFLGYAGFVLWAGPLIFWTLVWPAGQRHRRLLRLSGVGAVLLILTSVLEPTLRLTGGQSLAEVAPPLAGAAVLVRLAILAASLFYLTDLVSGTVVGSRRAVALAGIVAVAVTMAVQPTVLGQPSPVLAALGTIGHLLATAAWLGGLVALATVVRRSPATGETGGLVSRFSPVATLGLVLLVLASGITVLAAAAGRTGRDGGGTSGLVLRLVLLGLLLGAAWYAHRVTARLAFRRLSPMAATGPARNRALTVVVGTQLAIALGALSTAMVVCLTA